MSKERILEAIKSGQIKMRPRWHFWLRAALALTATLLVLVGLLYLTSFIIFILRQTGAWFGPSFGARGWSELLLALPWWLVGLSLLFLILLEVLARHYAFVYRRSLLASLLVLVLVALLGGIIVGRTPLHRRWPLAGRFYGSFGPPSPRHFDRGVIIGLNPGGFILRNQNEENVSVRLFPETRFPLGADWATGTMVVVWSRRENGFLHALGVRPVGND